MSDSITTKSFGINASTLKIIAIIAMTMDHVGNVFWDYLPDFARVICYAPGGMTFPIMAYLLTEGYQHTKNFKKYALRLFIFALISLVPFAFCFGPHFNVLFTLLLGLIAIYLYDHMSNRFLFGIAVIGITLVTVLCDWMLMGVPMILCYHTIRNPKKRVIVPIIITWAVMIPSSIAQYFFDPTASIMGILPGLLYCVFGCTATIPLLLHYSKERGKPMKYFFYAYYPVHLTLLVLLRYVI